MDDSGVSNSNLDYCGETIMWTILAIMFAPVILMGLAMIIAGEW